MKTQLLIAFALGAVCALARRQKPRPPIVAQFKLRGGDLVASASALETIDNLIKRKRNGELLSTGTVDKFVLRGADLAAVMRAQDHRAARTR